MNTNNIKIFWDLDGTLAEFKPIKIDIKSSDDVSVQISRVLDTPSYYLKLKPYENIITLAKKLAECGIESYILSCYRPNVIHMGKLATPLKDKKDWCDSFINEIPKENRIFVKDGESKTDAIMDYFGLDKIPNNFVLIDDYKNNYKPWIAKGGSAFKCLNGINSPDPTLESISIYENYEDSRNINYFLYQLEKCTDSNELDKDFEL